LHSVIGHFYDKTGKTTLAHIVARHAGYRPLEVNASDDRSTSVLTERIRRAMESTTLNLSINSEKSNTNNIGRNDHGKPNCLILDEIDGADAKGAIQALADIIKAEIPVKSCKQKSKSTAPYLRRPIICICNYKYAPALRPLLPLALHFNVQPPSTARLVARLSSILNKEMVALMAGGSLLHQLVMSTGGDIRSCLFTLQFAATALRAPHQDLSQSLINSLNGSGLKDDRNDVTSTINTVFRKVKSKVIETTTTTSKLALPKHKKNIAPSNVSRVMHAVEGFADDVTTINALFMNVLRVSYIDPAFDRCWAAHELLSGSDDRIFSMGSEYSLMRVNTPAVAAAIHLLCRVEMKPQLTFSTREMADSRYQQEANRALVQKFSEGLPVYNNQACLEVLSQEFIPLVLWMLSAGEGISSLSRPASSMDILTQLERMVADRHVAHLCALGLSYVADLDKDVNNAPKSSFRGYTIEMKLDPPIDRLVKYNALRNTHLHLCRKEIPSNMKMLLAQQVRLENFRKREYDTAIVKNPTNSHGTEVVGHVQPKENEIALMSRETKAAASTAEPQGTPRKLDQVASSAGVPDAKRLKVGNVNVCVCFAGSSQFSTRFGT
jgi:chromosome transmission fidelity protein 18